MRDKFFFILILVFSFNLLNVSAQTPKPKTISGGIINGKATSLPKPEYPVAAFAVKASGEVKVQVTIDENGNVISASAVSGHSSLRQAAEQAARLATFKPTLLSGQPAKVTGVIIYNFVDTKSTEDEPPVWAFGMFLAFLQSADSALITEIGDEKELSSILTEMAGDVPAELVSEQPLFDKFAKAVGDERRQLAGELLNAIKKHLSGDEKWQVEIGEHLGSAMTELIKHKKNIAGGSKTVNETVLRMNLQKIQGSLLSAPTETSSDLMKKFKNVAEFANAPELTSPETLTALLNSIEPLFGSFSDD